MASESPRKSLADVRRIVLKIGSRSLVGGGGRYAQLAAMLAAQRAAGRSVVLVSSGAVAVGRERLGFTERPKQVTKLQAAAAAGQSHLMRAYEEAFSAHGLVAAQVPL